MHLAQRVLELEESATLVVSEKAARLKAQGMDVVSFAPGEPDFPTPAHIREAAVRAMEAGHTRYTANAGILSLREAVAQKYDRRYKPSEVLVSCGAKHAIYNVLQAILDPGDEVLIPSPSWVSYPEMVKIAGARPILVPQAEERGFRLDAGAFRERMTPKTRAVIFCTPSNPTGAVYEETELRALADCLEKTDAYVISDEVYEKLVYDGARHVSAFSVAPHMRERTITINSVSKSFAMTGWRIGFAIGPEEVIRAAGKVQSQSTSNANSIAQHAAVAALTGGLSCVDAMVAEYDKRRRYVLSRLRALPGLTCCEPRGAFYVFPNVSAVYGRRWNGKEIASSLDFAEALLESVHVSVVPGEPFGSDAHVRVSYATSMGQLEEGLDRWERFWRELR